MKKRADILATMAASWRRGCISPSIAVASFKDSESKLKTLSKSARAVIAYLNRKGKKYKRPPCDKRPCTNRNVGRSSKRSYSEPDLCNRGK